MALLPRVGYEGGCHSFRWGCPPTPLDGRGGGPTPPTCLYIRRCPFCVGRRPPSRPRAQAVRGDRRGELGAGPRPRLRPLLLGAGPQRLRAVPLRDVPEALQRVCSPHLKKKDGGYESAQRLLKWSKGGTPLHKLMIHLWLENHLGSISVFFSRFFGPKFSYFFLIAAHCPLIGSFSNVFLTQITMHFIYHDCHLPASFVNPQKTLWFVRHRRSGSWRRSPRERTSSPPSRSTRATPSRTTSTTRWWTSCGWWCSSPSLSRKSDVCLATHLFSWCKPARWPTEIRWRDCLLLGMNALLQGQISHTASITGA